MAGQIETTSDFENHFDPEWYINNYTNNCPEKLNSKSKEIWFFSLDKLHEVFSTGSIKGHRLLDVGTGPSISSIISASDHVEELYLSDYATANRKVLFDWLNSKRDLDSTSFEYILSKQWLQTDVASKYNEIRKKVKAVLPIDVNKELPLGTSCDVNEFDVIITKLCLESACGNILEFRKSVKNLVSMAKPGGHIVMIGITGSTWYCVGDRKFKNLCLKHSDVMAAFEEAGVDVLKYEINQVSGPPNMLNTFKNVYLLVARRHE